MSVPPLSRIQKRNLKKYPVRVEIKHSPVHGNGVFAVSDIQAGSAVCRYDGYVIQNPSDEQKHDPYAIYSPKGGVCIGFQELRHAFLCGQFINDAAKMETLVDAQYEQKSSQGENVYFGDREFSLFAKRDILAGEELFMSYGKSYWIGQLQKTGESILKNVHTPCTAPIVGVCKVCGGPSANLAAPICKKCVLYMFTRPNPFFEYKKQ